MNSIDTKEYRKTKEYKDKSKLRKFHWRGHYYEARWWINYNGTEEVFVYLQGQNQWEYSKIPQDIKTAVQFYYDLDKHLEMSLEEYILMIGINDDKGAKII
jgi:hypothetical protein